MRLKDYYKILGVRPNASGAEIKKAYRALAVKYHPDKHEGNALYEVQFKEVAEAYAVLGNERKRAAYDDERWLNGLGSKTNYDEGVTPAWLLKICVELNDALAKMDTHRMSQTALQAYILMILDNSHMAILLEANETNTNKAIVEQLIKATAKLEISYLADILILLHQIAPAESTITIRRYNEERKAEDRRERMFPYVVLLVTLALCVFMYLYSGGY